MIKITAIDGWFKIENGGAFADKTSTAVFHFLAGASKHMHSVRFGAPYPQHAIEPNRLERFQSYCKANGFETSMA